MATTVTPLLAADEALTNLVKAKDTRDSIARTIAGAVIEGQPVVPAVRQAYILACVVVAAAEDMFLDTVGALQAAS